ncbi:MAG TPA: hypothetical protein VIV58_08160 [Kofleriaceae bacterium]
MVSRAAIALAAVFGLVVALHLPMLYRASGARGAGHCPFGYDRVAVAHAPARPGARTSDIALGFRLGATTRADIESWAAARGLGCTAKHGGASIECANVAAQLLPRSPSALFVTGAWFGFDAAGTLTSLRTIRRIGNARGVVAAFDATNRGLARAASAPPDRSGSPGELALGALRQASAEYRTPEVVARVRATNMGNGFVLTEDYALRTAG